MATEVDEIGGDVVMWPLKMMDLRGCCYVAIVDDEIGGDVAIWTLKLMRLERMS